MTTACLTGCANSATRLPVEKVYGVYLGFRGDVDRCSRLPFIVPLREDVEAHLEFVVKHFAPEKKLQQKNWP